MTGDFPVNAPPSRRFADPGTRPSNVKHPDPVVEHTRKQIAWLAQHIDELANPKIEDDETSE